MAIVGPSLTELAEIAADLGFHFDAADIAAFRELMRGALDAYSALDRSPTLCQCRAIPACPVVCQVPRTTHLAPSLGLWTSPASQRDRSLANVLLSKIVCASPACR
jgi:hypothetical protein